MAELNLTKVAVGCPSLEILAQRIAARSKNEVAEVTTRYRPTRHEELIGGSLYWIIKHKLAARQTILGFEEMESEKRWIIRLDSHVVAVQPRPRRAHQGWRYLKTSDAPSDLGALGDADELPPEMLGELSSLALL
ncbi:DUF1489 family protein [Sphingomonas cavernae]|uniref:DUF1489 family protein n=1 Tax=Sphingomonas cavernae TaxID=2320861 RepID=A0A418WRX6_9SPHN|nr:DUF1489 domain-containing protein [Sphingomonas cavernae]RJF93985.1 DUF1489 family protein [Sphingomonas cavernae]